MALPPLTIDSFIFVVFLLLNIIVGFFYRGGKQSFREFAVGDKQFSTAILTATIVATWMSGGALFINLEKTYKQGLYYVIPDIIGTPVYLLLMGYVIGPRMGRFLNNLSVPESLGKLYGKTVQVIAGIATVLRSTSYIAMQLQVIASILAILFNCEGPEIVTIVAAIITLYSLSGGVKAVTFTDVLQFFTFGTLLPLLALTIWNNLQDPAQVTHMFRTNPLFSFKDVVKWSPESGKALLFMAYLMTPILQPQLFQRVVMARDTVQIQRSFGYAAIVCLGIELCMLWIAMMILVDRPGPEADKIMRHIVDTYTYPGFKGLLGIGVIALSMSTADSVLNACAVIVANDILPPLGLQKQSSLNTARWATLVLGTLSLALALSIQDLLNILRSAANFYTPIVAVPILLAIFGFQTSRRVVLMSMGIGSAATAACLFYFESVHSFFPALLANIMTMLCQHYLLGEPGGWQKLDPTSPFALERAARVQRWQWRLKTIKNFKLYPYLQQNLPQNEGFYFFFGLYTIAATYVACYTLSAAETKACQQIYDSIYRTVLVGATAFLTFPVWPPTLKNSRFMAFFWPLGIGTLLFFVGTLLVIMSRYHHMQVMIMMMNLLMAVLLLHWPLAIFLASSGTYAAVFFFTRYTGSVLPLSVLGSVQMLYCVLLFVSLALKGKQVYRGLVISHAQLKEDNSFTSQMFLTTMRHQAQLQQEASLRPLKAVGCTESWATSQRTTLQNPTKAQLMASNAALEQRIYELDTRNRYLQQLFHLAREPMRLVVECIDLDVLWQDVQRTIYQHNQATKVILQHHASTKLLQGDRSKIRRLLRTAVAYAEAYPNTQRPVLLHIDDTQLAYPIMSIPNYIKRVRALCVMITTEITPPRIKQWYLGIVDHVSLPWIQDVGELSLAYHQQIVAAHYGAAEIIPTATGVTQVYVFPEDVRAVRPPMMDQYQVTPSSEMIPEAVQPVEQAFVQQVLAETPMERKLLEKAIQLIKQIKVGGQRDTAALNYLHPIAVASILLTYTRDADTLLAALLHDTIDTTRLSSHYISLHFNPVVKRIVEGVSSVDSRLNSFKKIQLSDQEIILKLVEEKDKRVLYVKLADHLHHIRMMESHLARTQQEKMVDETLKFYVPIATHLGLEFIAKELRQRCTRCA
ncbi:MAG: HD domain-containing protein [Amoebophilaceae bacterium]|jgi:Na+/proline symporter|nr:HD domain-containing protein [Amoebophilaceae bacterium]